MRKLQPTISQRLRRAHRQAGFSLAATIVLSVTLLALCLALMQTATIVRSDIQTQYYQTLAEEAAEAGLAHASSCLGGLYHSQTWGASANGDLKPNTDCTGAAVTGVASTVYATSSFQTAYDVGNLDTAIDNGVQISATGTTVLKVGGSVAKTYTAVLKKTITWDPNLASQQSSSGITRTCGILGSNVYCWGTNIYGQLGNGKLGEVDCPSTLDCDNSAIPVKLYRDPSVLGSKKIINLASGAFFNCVIASDNQVYCWGRNEKYQLGNTGGDSGVPVLVSGLAGKTIVGLGVSSQTACALTNIGDVYCWGNNNTGQIGSGSSTKQIATPSLIAGPSLASGPLAGKTIISLSTNGTFSDSLCAIDSTNKAYCWGSNNQGELGINAIGGWYGTPQAVYTGGALSGKKIIAIQNDGNDSDDTGKKGNDSTIGDAHTCAVAYSSTPDDAKVYCWGSNSKGNLGNNGTTALASNKFPTWIYSTPQAVNTSGVLSGLTITSVATGDAGSCVTAYPSGGSTDDQRAYCWGPIYAVGNGGPKSSVPVMVNDASNNIFANNKVDNLIGGAERFCARVQQTAYCWGANDAGQIGTGSVVPTTVRVPTEATFLRNPNSQYIF